MRYIKTLYLIFNTIRFIPHIIFFEFILDKQMIQSDMDRWVDRLLTSSLSNSDTGVKKLLWLLSFRREFRNLFLYRVRERSSLFFHICNILSPRLSSLYMPTPSIGGGFYIEHGFCTIVAAEKIGENCSVYQQVTIGYDQQNKAPVIGNAVTIYPGAKVIGGIVIGDNVTIGANAVVVKDVPPNCTVAGVPASIIRKNGAKVTETL